MHKKARQAIRESPCYVGSMPTKSLEAANAKPINIFESILTSKILSAQEKRANRVAQEGFVVLVAGGETTARVLITATFHILANRETVLLRLKDELATAMADPDTQVDMKQLEQLPWLVSLPFGSNYTTH